MVDDALLQDILAQPAALRAALAAQGGGAPRVATAARGVARIVFAGMGASFFACYPAVQRLWAAGRPAVWLEAGELLHFLPSLAGPESLLVLVSQSGRTAEIVHLLQRQGPRGPVVAVTNDPGSPLAQAAAVVVPLHAGEERAVCSTKTYTCSLCALDLVADALLGESLGAQRWPLAAAAVQQALDRRGEWFPPLAAATARAEHLWLLGRGPALSAALTGALIIKEASRVHAEGMSVPQFRHGPLEGAGPGRDALVHVTPGPLGDLDLDLAAEMARVGTHVAAVLSEPERPIPPGILPVWLPAVPPGLEALSLILPAQLLAHACARAQGRDPARLSLIGKVTERE